MGKNLIIKGADFSQNGIIYTVPALLSILPLTVGMAWQITRATYGDKSSPHRVSNNNSRASQSDFFDITQYGIGAVTLTAKSGYKFAAYFGNTNTPDTPNANILDNWTYVTSGNSLSVDLSGISYVVIMVAANDDSVLTSADWETYIEESGVHSIPLPHAPLGIL